MAAGPAPRGPDTAHFSIHVNSSSLVGSGLPDTPGALTSQGIVWILLTLWV